MACPPELMLNGSHPIFAVPWEVARCPECRDWLVVDVVEWDEVTGFPATTGIELSCRAVAMFDGPVTAWNEHEHHQHVWQRVQLAVQKWLEAVET